MVEQFSVQPVNILIQSCHSLQEVVLLMQEMTWVSSFISTQHGKTKRSFPLHA